MLRYTLERLATTLPTVLLVAISVFVLMRVVPGDPAALLVGDGENPERVEQLRQELGLNRSWFVQFRLWITAIVQGDFGVSLMNGQPVLPLMIDRFLVTLQIVAVSVALATAIAVPLGIVAAWKQNRPADTVIVFTSIAGMSVPSFWLGLILILVFGIELGWFPTVGYVSPAEDIARGALYLVMPVAALVLAEVGTIVRMARASTIEVMRLDYITHARAKGLAECDVLARHAFPNAFAPTLTVIGLIFGSLLVSAAVIEVVFTIPGLGRLLIDAISARDYPIVQGAMLLVALCYILINLVTDLLYPLFDPRVRL